MTILDTQLSVWEAKCANSGHDWFGWGRVQNWKHKSKLWKDCDVDAVGEYNREKKVNCMIDDGMIFGLRKMEGLISCICIYPESGCSVGSWSSRSIVLFHYGQLEYSPSSHGPRSYHWRWSSLSLSCSILVRRRSYWICIQHHPHSPVIIFYRNPNIGWVGDMLGRDNCRHGALWAVLLPRWFPRYLTLWLYK